MAVNIPYSEHLLPPNASDAMRVVGTTLKRISSIPVPIGTVKQPLATPAAFLPFVAWEYSVDIWNPAWPEARARAVAQRSLALHMKKGTAAALREYARYADAEVLKIERPPMKIFSGKSLTREEREKWLSTLPQIRLWRVRESGIAPRRKAFLGGSSSLRKRSARHCLGHGFATPSTAKSRLKARARWVVGGVETDVRVSNVGTAFRLHIKGLSRRRVFCGRPMGRKFFTPSDARRRIVTIAPKAGLPWRSAVAPSLQAVTSEPERVVVRGSRGKSVFCGRPVGGFFVPSSAALRIYHRFAVYDGRAAARRHAVKIMGKGRYGLPPHTAKVHLSVPGKRGPRVAGEGIVGRRKRFWHPHDPSRLREARAAIAASKRLSDRIMLKIGPTKRFLASSKPLLAGIDEFIVGRP